MSSEEKAISKQLQQQQQQNRSSPTTVVAINHSTGEEDDLLLLNSSYIDFSQIHNNNSHSFTTNQQRPPLVPYYQSIDNTTPLHSQFNSQFNTNNNENILLTEMDNQEEEDNKEENNEEKLNHKLKEEEESELTINKYLELRKKRKLQFKCCCTFCCNFCCLRIPIIDLINENMFFRVIVLLLFVKIYFMIIFISKLWVPMADENLQEAMSKCDKIDMVTNQNSALQVLFITLLTGLTTWSVAYFNNITKLSLKYRFISFIIVNICIAIDVIIQIFTVKCYTEKFFDNIPEYEPFPFLNPYSNEINFIETNDSTVLTSIFKLLNLTAEETITNIKVAQNRVFASYLIISWIISFGIVIILYIPLATSIIMNLKKNEKWKCWFSFYDDRLNRFYSYVTMLVKDISKRRKRKRLSNSLLKKQMSELNNNSEDISDVISDSSSVIDSEDNDDDRISANSSGVTSFITLQTSMASDSYVIDDRINDKLENYWNNSDRNIVIKYFVINFMKIKYMFKVYYFKLKRLIHWKKSTSSIVNFFFPTRLMIGMISSLIVTSTSLILLAVFIEPILYGIANFIFIILLFLRCIWSMSDQEKFIQCQINNGAIILRILDVCRAGLALAVILTFLIILVCLILICLQYKEDSENYRRGKLHYKLNSYSILYASDYPGLQSAHVTVATFLYFFAIFFTILIIGIIILLLICLSPVLGDLITSLWNTLWDPQFGLGDKVVSFLFFTVGLKILLFLLTKVILRIIYVKKRGNWLVNIPSYSGWDFTFIIFNYLFAFLVALTLSILKMIGLGLIRYVRLDSSDNLGFYSYVAMLKIDGHNANPIINVFIDLIKQKANAYEKSFNQLSLIKYKEVFNKEKKENLIMDNVKNVKENIYKEKCKPRLKNYLLLIGFLHENRNLTLKRNCVTSEYFDESTHEDKRVKIYNGIKKNLEK
ncbi:hypothetical protein ABK040_009209 [Willaertia magna]